MRPTTPRGESVGGELTVSNVLQQTCGGESVGGELSVPTVAAPREGIDRGGIVPGGN